MMYNNVANELPYLFFKREHRCVSGLVGPSDEKIDLARDGDQHLCTQNDLIIIRSAVPVF